MKFYSTICLLFLLCFDQIAAQVAADCVNAIPICTNTPVNSGTKNFGIDDFHGAFASGCLEETLSGAVESNSAWYRFRTGASGQLGFNIGIDKFEDWDFALYRSNDCGDLGEPIRCNFFDNGDENSFMGVGNDPTGDMANIQYEDWLEVEAGEDYYLLLNNFSNINSGFSIQFSGNIFVTNPFEALDCSIINNLLGPHISACEGTKVILDATTTDAVTYKWFENLGNGYVIISGENNETLSIAATASYRVEVIMPSNKNLISEVQVVYSVLPTTNPVSDITDCDLLTFDLKQKDSEALGSQNSAEFLVSYYTSLSDAQQGINFLPKQYSTKTGQQTIYVRTTSMANPNCYDASQKFNLTSVETPLLDFPMEEFICQNSGSIVIGKITENSNYDYQWSTGENTSSINVSQEGNYTLTVTNMVAGVSCSKSRTVSIVFSTPPVITNVIIDDLQKNNEVLVKIDKLGEFEYWLDDEKAQLSNIFRNVAPGVHTITVNDPGGCGSVTEDIIVVGFPKFFTPNGDGTNDHWKIEGISSLKNPVVHIFDRVGKLITQLNGQNSWNGMFNGKLLPSTDYWFKLTYTDTKGQRATAKYVNNHFSLKN